jgi:hypothetical protein
MADKVIVEGQIANKPIADASKAKVQDALKNALQSELLIPPTSGHGSIVVHYSSWFDSIT